jgi:cation/acetate symporter
MSRSIGFLAAAFLVALQVSPAFGAPAAVGETQQQPVNVNAIIMFLIFVGLTLGITYWASKRTKTASDFYAAGRGISGTQNGLAIAGDYMSAATLLGLTSLVYMRGFDGFIYCIAFYACWPFIMFVMAERLRNLGKFTFADIVSYRLDQRKVRTMAAIGSLTVVIFYLTAQMVGAGQLIKLLFGMPYWSAVALVGVLMVIYVTFGGMIATTWVQIIKACLLLGGGTLVMLLAFSQFGFNFETLATAAVAASPAGIKLMGPGTLLADPVTAVSLGLGLMFGTAGLPHILMRFFTVPNAKEARKSVFVATFCVGFFFCVVCIMGLAAIVIVGQNPAFFEGGNIAGKMIGGGNMPAMHLAQAVGGNILLGFLAAVAFATILAVVAGLALAGAGAIAHDLYANVIMGGRVTEAAEVRISRLSSFGLGILAVLLGIVFEKMNIAFLVGLTFGIAASCNFPILILSMYWKGLTTRGAVWGGLVGLVTATAIVVFSKAVWVTVLGHSAPLFPYEQPALFSMPLAFLVAYVVSVLDKSPRATKEIAAYDDQMVRAQTGFGAAGASSH